MNLLELTDSERNQIAEVLKERANEIAMFKMEQRDLTGSVASGLSREMQRLRRLADKVKPETEEVEE